MADKDRCELRFRNLVKGQRNMKHWWQGWSVWGSYLFGVFIVLLNIIGTALAKSTHSTLILILVEIGGLLLIIWAARILIWNIQHTKRSPKKE